MYEINTDFIISLYKIGYEDALEGWQSNGWKVQNTTAKIESKGIEKEPINKKSEKFNVS